MTSLTRNMLYFAGGCCLICCCLFGLIGLITFFVAVGNDCFVVTPPPPSPPPPAVPTCADIDSRCVDANIIRVTRWADNGTGTFRAALDLANNRSGFDCILFGCEGDIQNVIELKTLLPAISDPVYIDGCCNGRRTCLEGSTMTTVNCSNVGVGTNTPTCGSFPPAFLQVGDLFVGFLGNSSIIRGLLFNNAGSTKNNIQPETAILGPCSGVVIVDTCNVTVEDCEFVGFLKSTAAVWVGGCLDITIRKNLFDSVMEAILLCSSFMCHVTDNVGDFGFPGQAETERVGGHITVGVHVFVADQNFIVNNTFRGFDIPFYSDIINADNYFIGNKATDARFSSAANVLLATRNLFMGNDFDRAPQHIYMSAVDNNPVLSNSLRHGALYAIDNDKINHYPPFLEGITFNDNDDPDLGSQGLQNYPDFLVYNVSLSSGIVLASGTLNSRPNKFYVIQCFIGDESNRNAPRLISNAFVQTDFRGDTGFNCSCGNHSSLAPCIVDIRSLGLSKPIYVSGTATVQVASGIVCPTVVSLMLEAVHRLQTLRIGVLSEMNSTQTNEVSAHIVRLTSWTHILESLGVNVLSGHTPAHCTGGVAVCSDMLTIPDCSLSGVSSCPSNCGVLCLGDTSEVSYAWRADHRPIKVFDELPQPPAPVSPANRLSVPLILLLIVLVNK